MKNKFYKKRGFIKSLLIAALVGFGVFDPTGQVAELATGAACNVIECE